MDGWIVDISGQLANELGKSKTSTGIRSLKTA
jgi:hypothetical protein